MDSWQQATLALQLLALDPGLGGIVVRARAGPVRDRLLEHVGPARRIHPAIPDAALFGGLNLAATLEKGRIIQEQSLFSEAGPLILTMAERAPRRLCAHLAGVLDRQSVHTVIALDEGAEPDEALDPKLAERLAFFVDLSDVSLRDVSTAVSDLPGPAPTAPSSCRELPSLPCDAIETISKIALDLGIDRLRAPVFTLRAARAHARLSGRNSVTFDDLETACALTLVHRATRLPEAEEPQSPAPDQYDPKQDTDTLALPEELLLDAVRAMLPDNLLDRLAARKARAGRGNGSGATRKANRRGRPLPARPGRPHDGARIDLIATLRAAAPWQTIRKRATGRDSLQIRGADIHLKRYEEKSDRLLIFTVDASGSTALTRLAEAKGAVELLLSQAYARRDHVALVAFRGTEAELLLPPTRSLVQTKRRLAALPGGGGTPLAAGLMAALGQATQAARRGLTPTAVILTDGRANIALDGSADRKQAATDAQQVARVLRASGTDALVIDTGNRPEPALRHLAQMLDAPYLPLPRADAQRLSQSVSAALGD